MDAGHERATSRRRVAAVLMVGLFLAGTAMGQGDALSISLTVGSDVTLPAPWGATASTEIWTLEYCVDLLTADVDPADDVGVYPGALTSLSMTIGGVEVAGDLGGVNLITVVDNENQFFGVADAYEVDFELVNGAIGRFRIADAVLNPNEPVSLMSDDLIGCEDVSQLQIGAFVLTGGDGFASLFPASDLECGVCALPECFLVIGPAPGSEPFVAIGHEFTTQVGAIEQSFPVLMEDTPEFVIWEAPPSMRTAVHGLGSAGGGASQPLGGTGAGASNGHGQGQLIGLEDDPLPQVFFAQVLMWNPQAFPGNPEQYTQGLAVTVMPNGRVFTVPYGTSDGGLELWAETEWNDQGQKVLRLPFSIPGF